MVYSLEKPLPGSAMADAVTGLIDAARHLGATRR
jgi:hypothetical protein